MATLAEIYNWFMTGKKPTQAQFWAAWGSFWNKNESIPQSSISGLTSVLNAKVENDQFNAHKGANDAHAVLFQAKEDKAQKGAPNGYAPLDQFTKLAAQYLNIVNDLVTGGTTALLSAEQGKVLQTRVSAINTLLTSDNVNLDTVQELVDAIETVQLSLSTILVNDLTTGGTTKALTAEMGKTLKGLIDGLLSQVTSPFIYKIGQLCIFKNPGNESNNDYLEPGDTVIGFVEGEFLNSGTYYGGDPTSLNSYTAPEIEEPYYNFELIYSNPYSSEDYIFLKRYLPPDYNVEEFKTFYNSEKCIINEESFVIELYSVLTGDTYRSYYKFERFNGTDWVTETELLDDYGVFLSTTLYFTNPTEKLRFTFEIREVENP